MICWKCGYQNPDDGKFCSECGTPLQLRDTGSSQENQIMVCWKCGYLNSEKNQFCEKCGASIWHADPVPGGEPVAQIQPGFSQGSSQPGYTQGGSQPGYSQGSSQPGYTQGGSQPGYTQGGSQPGYSQGSSQPGFSQGSSQSGYNQGSSQPRYNQESSRQPAGPEKEITPLKIAALVFAAIYIIRTLCFIPGVFVSIGSIFRGHHFIMSAGAFLLSVLGMVSCALAGGMLVLFGMRRTKENGERLYLGVLSVMALQIIVLVINMIWSSITWWRIFGGAAFSLILIRQGWPVLFAVIVAAVLYGLFVMAGEKPFEGKSSDEIKQMLKDLPETIQKEMGQFSFDRPARKEDQMQQAPPAVMGPEQLKTDRSLLLYILFSLITCGIYPLYFYYSIAQDINTICSGDGEQTAGLLKHLLLDLVTCGIYEYIWQYQFADRLGSNAPKYGVTIQESGTTILLWWILGFLCCGIGPLVALHIQIKNLNKMARAYNERIR